VETSKYHGSEVVGTLVSGDLLLTHQQWLTSGESTSQPALGVVLIDQSGEQVREIAAGLADRLLDHRGYRFFGQRPTVATDGKRVFVSVVGEWTILVLSPRGDTVGMLRRPWTARAVTEQEKSKVRGAFPKRNLAPGFLGDDRFEKTVPPHGSILASSDGTLWVLDYRAPYQYTDSISVFSADYVFLGTLSLPRNFYPTAVGPDFMLGTGKSEDDDFEIRRYSIRWPGARSN
jgi:hypothetical protein